MKIALVCGYGSIGKRHVHVLEECGYEVSVVSRHQKGDRFFGSLSDFFETVDLNLDVIVIASETNLHFEQLQYVMSNRGEAKVLVEKPLGFVDSSFRGEGVYVGFNLRFHPAIQKLRRALSKERVLHASLEVRRYLPTMRSGGRDYKLSYSCFEAKGGGVQNDFSHELDMACFLFGKMESFESRGGHLSHLHGDSMDSLASISGHKKCPLVVIQMTYLDRAPGRFYRVITQDKTYCLDLDKGVLDGGPLSEDALDQSYQMQLKALEKDHEDLCSLTDAMNIERWIRDFDDKKLLF